MKSKNNKKGMTVVEILVVLFITVLLILVVWLIFSTGFKSYQGTSERIDAQSQFRLVIDILKEEVGYAKNVSLQYYSDTGDIPVAPTNFAYIYIKPVGDDMYSLCKKDETGETIYETPFPLKGFNMRFQMDPTVPEANILTVWLYADGTDEFREGIFIQNTNITFVTSTSGYNTLYYENY